ncbi:MAG: glutamate 5-kinase [Candidatus Kerfeldbacteria bacterium]|nr:glutamate 5-kinase [Candidatus Kerfeldbacteria bacterium]
MSRSVLDQKKRLVLKLGSSVLTRETKMIDRAWLHQLAGAIVKLKSQYDIVVVCSGAATEGKHHVQLTPAEKSKYTEMARKQLYAAVGQPYLLQALIEAFNPYGVTIGQALLTRNTFSELNRYYNTTAVLNHMLDEGIIPIINGNDVITTLELSSGGNDGLAAVLAIALDADRLVLMTNTDGVYDKNPFGEGDAKKFYTVKDPDILLRMIDAETSQTGIGGMQAKVQAARLAWYAGIQTVVANGLNIETYQYVMDDAPPGTWFIPPAVPSHSEQAKIRWFLSARNNFGSVIIDAGAEQALKQRKSLLFVGVKEIRGEFRSGDIISIENTHGQIVACGLVAYDARILQQAVQEPSLIDKPVVHANKLKLLYV